jgi:hypothetical protein
MTLLSAVRRQVEGLAARAHARAALRRPSPVITAHRNALRPLIQRLSRTHRCRSVLDVGTGRMDSLALVTCPAKIGLDPHRPYLLNRIDRAGIPINAAAQQLAELFVPDAVDLVMLIDVLEHFAADQARDVLRQAESVAARLVLLFTPRGEFPQEGFDAFSLGGEEYQKHRSAWEPEDLVELGYRVVVLSRFHGPANESFVEAFGPSAPPVDALLAYKVVGQARREHTSKS